MTPARCSEDFFEKSQKVAEDEGTNANLCCCEYIDKNAKKYHILGCCCNCEDFDAAFTRLVSCRHIDQETSQRMLLTFQDRLRIPWRGGAKQVSLETILPLFAVPLAIGIAAINMYTACLMFLSCTVFIGYVYHLVRRSHSRTRFLFMWVFWSIVYIIILFEFTVPLLELLPEENLVLVLLSSASVYCLWRTKQRAVLNHVGAQNSVNEDELPDIVEEETISQTALLLDYDIDETADGTRNQPNICSTCRKYVPPRTVHCSVCNACIKKSDHHSFFLNCCVGESNHRYYLAGLLLAELALVLGTNLTLTAICHPFLIARILNVYVMLPDDCSEVFHDYQLGISFVIAIYGIIMAIYVFVVIVRQFYSISQGTTLQERKRGQVGNRKNWWTNWKVFIKK